MIKNVGTVLLLTVAFGVGTMYAQTYDKLWKQVEQAVQKDLPQTVIGLANEIYQKGRREQNVPQMLKAYICREAYQQRLTPDSLYTELDGYESFITNYKREDTSDKSAVNKAVIHSLLAEKYAEAMRRNRRALQGRTQIEAEDAPEDVRQWSINLFMEKIDENIRLSLQDSLALLETSAREYVPFTVLQEGSRYYGHDMYHLLASRAISLYGNNGFFPYRPTTRQAGDYKERIGTIYENMIRAYRHRGMEDAALLCELDYFDYKLQATNYKDSSSINLQTQKLDSLIGEFGKREVCAEVYFKKASLLRDADKTKEALEVCDEGIRRYPKYPRTGELRNLRAEILKPSLHVSIDESGYPGDSMEMRVGYRNISNYKLQITRDKGRDTRDKIQGTRYETYELPNSVAYRDTVLHFLAPQETGKYTLRIIPGEPCNDLKDLALSFNSTRFKVLTMSVGDGHMEVTALDASTGWPIDGATVSFYSSINEQDRKLLAEVVTDAGGKAVLPWQKGFRSCTVRKETDFLDYNLQNTYYRPLATQNLPLSTHKVTLLTDRSLYRPGQTVYIKGIAYTQYADSAHVLEGADYEVSLQDSRHKEIALQKVRTNDFGSFSAEFVLPDTCMNGVFSIRTREPQSSVSFRVEEYKRPTFEINFTPVSEAYQLGDTVMLKGNVKAFNGRTIQDMPLTYTVSRYSPWLSVRQTVEPLKADTVLVDADGDFSIPLVLEKPEEEFGSSPTRLSVNFKIEAAVTDEAGETQAATYSLQASDKPFRIHVDLPQQLCKEDSLDFQIDVTNMAGVPMPFQIADFRLQSSSESHRIDLSPDDNGVIRNLPSGEYRLKLSVRDSLGHEGTYESPKFILFSKQDKRPASFAPLFYYGENEEFDAEHPATFLLGTSHRNAYVMMNLFCDRRRIESRTMQLTDTIVRMEFPYREDYGNGVTVLLDFVKDGKAYSRQIYLKKRQPQRALTMRWEVFRDRLQPGQQEEWRLVIKNPQGLPAAAEMLATMYDASLDKLYKRNQSLRVVYPDRLHPVSWNTNRVSSLVFLPSFSRKWWKVPAWAFDYFYSPYAVAEDYGAVRSVNTRLQMAKASNNVMADYAAASMKADEAEVAVDGEAVSTGEETLQPAEGLRTNFAETAFFYPQLRTNAEGEVAFSFTMPQSLTRWNFRAYSHTQEMLTGHLEASVVTVKEFMLTTNMPRYVRVGDQTEIAATIANLTDREVKGTATFTLFDPATEKVISTRRKKFTVGAGKNTAVAFPFQATEKLGELGVRIMADGGNFSDGEQYRLPVLSNKEQITETLALTVRSGQTRTFPLDDLFNHDSPTATDRQLTVELTENPAWMAVKALSSLGCPTSGNAISWASAWYANCYARYLADSNPSIKEAVPDSCNRSALAKLEALQGEDGGWSWYKGMSANRYVTTYVTQLLVRLPQSVGDALPSEVKDMKQKAIGYLHGEALQEYRSMRKAEKDGAKHLSLSDAALRYLYILAVGGEKVPAKNEAAYRYFLSKVKDSLTDGSITRKSLSAIILYRAGHTDEARKFIRSIKEHLVQTDERGAYFAFHETSYALGMQPVPAHVLAMEALRLDEADEELIEEMKLWLLKQKQVTAWNTPVATADAVYALLDRRTSELKQTNTDSVRYVITQSPTKRITVENDSKEIAWGAVYAQYLSPLGDVEQQGGPLGVEKKLYVERTAADGTPFLQPIDRETILSVGDKVVSRLTIRLDRAMDFVQLKDARAACFEPTGALSGYRRSGGFGYYASVEDTATNYYFDHLAKGVHLLEHTYRIARRGTYEAGMATVQCTYAPEFSAHSDTRQVKVK